MAPALTALDALMRFSAQLCALGLDRGGPLEIEVPRPLFLELLREAYHQGLESPHGRVLRLAVYDRTPWPSTTWAGGEAAAVYAKAVEVPLTEELITTGMKVHVLSGPWLVRLKAADRAELLATWREHTR